MHFKRERSSTESSTNFIIPITDLIKQQLLLCCFFKKKLSLRLNTRIFSENLWSWDGALLVDEKRVNENNRGLEMQMYGIEMWFFSPLVNLTVLMFKFLFPVKWGELYQLPRIMQWLNQWMNIWCISCARHNFRCWITMINKTHKNSGFQCARILKSLYNNYIGIVG